MGKWTEDDKDQQLVESIRGAGQIQSVIVRPNPNYNKGSGGATRPKSYLLVAGSRRYHAAIKAGETKIRAIVRNLSDIEAMEVSYSENLGRKELTWYERAITVFNWYNALMKDYNMSRHTAQKHLMM